MSGYDHDEFIERCSRLMTERHLSEKALMRGAGFSPGTFQTWRKGSKPSVDKVAVLAESLGVAPEWLAFGVTGTPATIDPQDRFDFEVAGRDLLRVSLNVTVDLQTFDRLCDLVDYRLQPRKSPG